MNIFSERIAEVDVQRISPEAGAGRIVYLLEPVKVMGGLEDLAVKHGAALVSVFGMDWDNDLTPWAAPNVRKNVEDFGGGAEDFLLKLENEIVPRVEKEIKSDGGIFTPPERSLVGISLAGLFALWSSCRSDLFSGIGSVSGSLWYDGFLEWFGGRTPSKSVKNVYLSVGELEKLSKNKRFSAVEEKTEKLMNMLTNKGINSYFELNPGNHIADGELRIRKAIEWLLEPTARKM